ncbi:tetratricopeptide repeat protein [Pseudanabaena minima]|uniref:tetratricopeptide repeat protein n=1 Tax=Pseudanabaena minima TaxID=890415 RepID=UPI003DA8E305
MQRKALVVGVSQYSKLRSLESFANNANAIADILEPDFKVKRLPEAINVDRVVVGKSSLPCDRLQNEIKDLFTATDLDTVLFYYSGHGVQGKQPYPKTYLATSESEVLDDGYRKSIEIDLLKQFLRDCPAREQIVWLDCCYGGDLADFREICDRNDGKTRFIITASRDQDPAYQEIAGEMGVFTRVLVEALARTGTTARRITCAAIEDAVREGLQRLQYPQMPQFYRTPNKIIEFWERSSARQEAIAATLNTTPPPVVEWQGRQDEIKELQTALSNDKVRLIGITAAGGYGKSALAVKFKEQLTPNWRVLWVSFIQSYPLAQFGRWLLEQMGRDYDEKWDEETLIGQIVEGLIAEPYLLVLDNMETVIPAEGKSVYGQFLSQWLGNGSNSKLLLTSREQPVFSANLLPRCYWLALKGLAEADAMRLVTEDYGLTGTQEELAHFVNRMDRHPLLMQLVSSWMREELGEGVCVTEAENLGLDLFTVEGYHRDTDTCVREVVAASLARLSARLGDILKRLSVLRGIFDLGLAQGLTAEVTEAELRYLARLSLLQEFPPEPLKGKPRRFQFLPLISMVVQQQADSELLRSAHQAALDYFLAHLPAPPWESLEDLTAYLEGFYHAGALGEWQLAYDILNEDRGGEGKNKSVDEFLKLQWFYRQQAQLYEQVIAGSQREQVCYRNSLILLGNCYYFLGQYEKAIALYHQYQDISEEIGDRQGMANSLGNLGSCYYSLGQYKKAIAYHQQHHDISEEIGYRQGMARSLGDLGLCYYSLGQYEKAVAYHQQSLEIKEEISDRQGVARSLGNLGLCYHSLGQYERAIAYHQQHHDISEEIGFRQGVAISLGNLGGCYDSLGQYKKAIAYHQQLHDISEEIGDRQGVARSLGNLGNCYDSLGQYEKAITHHQQCHDISEEIGNRQVVAISLGNLGNCYASLGQYEKAIAYHQQYHDISEEIGFRQGVAISLHNIGEALLKLENYSEAETEIQKSLVISQEINFKILTAHSFKFLAEIAHQTNQPQLALTHCQAALTLSQELGIPLVKDCEELLAKIQENLGE